MSNVQIGFATLTEQPIEFGWDKKSGQFATRVWQGTEQQCRDAFALLTRTIGFSSVNVKQKSGGVWEVSGRIDGAVDDDGNPLPEQDIVDTWELTSNRVEKDILETDISAVNSLNATDLSTLRGLINGDTTNLLTEPSWVSSGSGSPSALYKLIKSGVKSSVVYAPVISKTQTASNSRVIAASLTNVGVVYTTATLLASESIPASIANNLVASTQRTITGLTFQYGWLKNFPVITDTVDGKVNLQQNWEWGLWSTVLYSVV